jgi:hypothetical protein
MATETVPAVGAEAKDRISQAKLVIEIISVF